MNEKLKNVLNKGKGALKKVSKKVWILAAVVLVVIAAGVTIFLNTRPYSVLITAASSDELTAVMSWLDTQGFRDYRIEGGDTILVPKAQEVSLKTRLLMEGYPKKGYSYSTYYDNVSALSTESERTRAYLLMTQENIAAVIRGLEGIKDAVVEINPGEDNRYVLDSSNVVKATAAVKVDLGSGERLSNTMAASIRNFVAHSVQGLEISSVTIIDNWGNSYNSGVGDMSGDAESSALKRQYEEEYENKIRTEVLRLLTPFFGEENVSVGVNCVVEVSSSTIDDYEVHLPEWANDGSTNGRGVIGTIVYDHTFTVNGDEPVGGTMGTQTNSDLPTYMEELDPAEDSNGWLHTSGEQVMDNSKTKTHTIRTAAYIADCTVAVGINAATAGAVDVATYRDLVAKAAGINAVATEEFTAEEYLASKISVVVEPFFGSDIATDPGPEPSPLPVPMWVIYAAAGGLLLFIVLLVLLLVLRKKRKKKQQQLAEQQQAAMEELLEAAGIPQDGEPVGADVMELQTERSVALRQDIRQFVESNPEIAAQLVKSWLKGDDDGA